jgi:uncharacterized protein YajQ (UPF0234 family)
MKTVLRDLRATVILFSLIVAFLVCAGNAVAQTQGQPIPNRPASQVPVKGENEVPLSSMEEELNAKRAIKLAEKEHQENLDRAREIAQIGIELRDSLKNKSSIDRECLKKVERLEKLTKKVRGEAGGEDEEVDITNRPTDIASATSQIAEVSGSLSKEVLDTPRQVVSASVIGRANVLLELIRMLRGFAR